MSIHCCLKEWLTITDMAFRRHIDCVAGLESELKEMQSALSRAQGAIGERDAQLKKLGATYQEAQHEIGVLRHSFDDTVKAKVTAEDDLATVNERCTALQRDMDVKNRSLNALQYEIGSMAAWVELGRRSECLWLAFADGLSQLQRVPSPTSRTCK